MGFGKCGRSVGKGVGGNEKRCGERRGKMGGLGEVKRDVKEVWGAVRKRCEKCMGSA